MSIELVSVLLLAASVVICAMVWGGQPERWCAAIIAAGVLIDRGIFWLTPARGFDHFDLTRLMIDVCQMVLFMGVSLRANRIYPLAMTSAQLLAIFGSIAVLVVSQGWTQAYWAMTQLPMFIQLGLLLIGTIAHCRRVSVIGNYNAWSPHYAGAREQL